MRASDRMTPSFALKFLPYLSVCLLALTGCQSYRWGQGQPMLKGHYSIGLIQNESDVTHASALLQARLLEGLRRQSRVQLGTGEAFEEGYLVEGRILEILKFDREQDEFGRPTEWQFEVDCLFTVTGPKGQPRQYQLTNRQHLRSSATYRPLDESAYGHEGARLIDEGEALNQAMMDLVENLMLRLSVSE